MLRPSAYLLGFSPPEVKPDGFLILPAKLSTGELFGLSARRELWRTAALAIVALTEPAHAATAPKAPAPGAVNGTPLMPPPILSVGSRPCGPGSRPGLRAYYEALHAEFSKSGLSQSAFAARHGLQQATLSHAFIKYVGRVPALAPVLKPGGRIL